MSDQADRLRALIQGGCRAAPAAAAPHVVAVLGGKGGVGTTTVALNLALALVQQGRSVALVDADVHRGDVAMFCRLSERLSVADVLAGRCELRDAVQPGPQGLHVVPAAWTAQHDDLPSQHAQRRFVDQIRALGKLASWVLLDVGNHGGTLTAALCRAADRVALVTTPDAVAIMDSYAALKAICADDPLPPVATIVNQSDDEATSLDVHSRLNQCCRRFLAVELDAWGRVPRDDHVRAASGAGAPLLEHAPGSPAAKTLARLAATLAGETGVRAAA